MSAWRKEKGATRHLTVLGMGEPQNLATLSEEAQQSQAEAGRVFYLWGTESLKGLGFSVPQAGNGSKIQQGGAEGDREEKGQIKEGEGHRARRSPK